MRSGEVGSDAGRGRLPGRTGPTIVALIALAAGGAGIGPQPARAQEPAKPAAEKAPEAKPADTVTAEKGRFEVVFEAKGDFDPVDSALVQLKAQQWAQPLEIMRIVPHGTRVNAGDVLVEFDTEKLDRAIAADPRRRLPRCRPAPHGPRAATRSQTGPPSAGARRGRRACCRLDPEPYRGRPSGARCGSAAVSTRMGSTGSWA